MADLYGPNDVYANIPRLDSHGRPQLPMFLRWNSDPVGNDAGNLNGLSPDLQRVVNRARADNPNLNFVIGNGRRSAADQDWAKSVGWSQVGSKAGGDANVHMNGNAVDLWGLDSNGHVQFNPDQQQQISLAMKKAAQEEGVGVNWGGDWKTFKDAPHFELSGGATAQPSGAEGPPALHSPSPSQPATGTTLNTTTPSNSNVIDTLSRNIAQIESGTFKNPYQALNPTTHAIGKYQVMPQNVPGWTLAATGKQMTPEEFKASPAAQEAVFRDQMQRNLQLYSPRDAASIWFTGKPFNVAGGSVKDAVGTTNASYVARATAGLPDSATFTPSAAVAPATGASTPTATGTTINTTGAGGGGAVLPGFADAKTSNQFLQNLDQFDKSIGGRGLGLQGQGQGEGQGQPDMRPSPMLQGPGLINYGPGGGGPGGVRAAAQQMLPSLTHYQPQAYGQTLNSDPLAIGAGTPQQPDWLKNAGLQQAAQPSPYGTSIGSMQMAYGLSPQQLSMLMSPWALSQAGGGYG